MAWRHHLAHATRGLLELLLPPCCPGCQRQRPLTPAGICRPCLRTLRFSSAHCPRCAFPYPGTALPGHLCERCLRQPPAFQNTIALGLYQGPLRQLVRGLKFTRRPLLDRPLGRLLARRLHRRGLTRPDLIVPVPLHLRRLRRRGYNQALLLARGVAAAWQMPVEADLLAQIRPTHTQKGLDAHQRQDNLRNVYAVNRQLNGERLLLVDDVMTTGATARACAAALSRAGAGYIQVAVLARAARLLDIPT